MAPRARPTDRFDGGAETKSAICPMTSNADDDLLNHRVTCRRNALQTSESDAQFVRLEMQSAALYSRLSYQHTHLRYPRRCSYFRFLYSCCSPLALECRLTYEIGNGGRAVGFIRCAPFGRLWYPKGGSPSAIGCTRSARPKL